MEHMRSILQDFGKRIGMANLDFESVEEGTGVCSLSFDDVAVNLSYNEEERVLYAHTAIAQAPENEQSRLELYTLILELNCGFRFTQGGILGLHDDYGIILSNRVQIENLSAATFEVFVENHVNFAEKIHEYFLENIEVMDDEANSTQDLSNKDLMTMMSLAIRI